MSPWDPTDAPADPTPADEASPVDDPIHRRLLSDGAAWRSALPATDALAAHVRSLPAHPAPRAPHRREDTAVIEQQPGPSPAGPHRPSTPPAPAPSPRAPWTGLRAVVAAGVALAVVAAFIFALHTAPKTGVSVAQKPTATAQTTATAGVTHGQWTPVPGLTHLDGMPVIAPSDPRVVYLADARLRRSADDGATWKDLPLPFPSSAGASYTWLDLFVSPTDADTVFVSASVNLNGACLTAMSPSHGATLAQLRGSPACSSQYVSADGGQTWKPLTIAGDSALRLGNLNQMHIGSNPYSTPPQAQGGALYSLAGYGPNAVSPGFRIVRSTDGGLTWQTIDGGLAPFGFVCDYAVSDTTSRVYALVSSQACSIQSSPPLQLWLTDNNGDRWESVPLLRQGLDMGMVVSGGALYLGLGQPSGQSQVCCGTLGPTDYLVYDASGPGRQSPAQGLPSQAVALSTTGMIIADPSNGIVVPFANPTDDAASAASLYSWSASQPSWQPIAGGGLPQTPPIPVTILLTSDHTAGTSSLWLVGTYGATTIVQYSVQRYTP